MRRLKSKLNIGKNQVNVCEKELQRVEENIDILDLTGGGDTTGDTISSKRSGGKEIGSPSSRNKRRSSAGISADRRPKLPTLVATNGLDKRMTIMKKIMVLTMMDAIMKATMLILLPRITCL